MERVAVELRHHPSGLVVDGFQMERAGGQEDRRKEPAPRRQHLFHLNQAASNVVGIKMGENRNRQRVVKLDSELSEVETVGNPQVGLLVDVPGAFEKQSAITAPASTPFFSDSVWVDGWPDLSDLPATDLYHGSDSGGGMQRLNISRHGYKNPSQAPRNVSPVISSLPGGIMVGFSDGHVQPEKLNNLWNLTWSLGWPR